MLVSRYYADDETAMRPVTKIRIFGVRLGIVALGLYWILIFTGTHLPKIPNVLPTVSDKAKHFTAFFGLAILLSYTTTSRNLLRRFSWIAIVSFVYAALDEITQTFIRGRTADVMDFVADAAGASVAIGCYLIARKIFPRLTLQPS